MDEPVAELVSFLRDDKAHVRQGAVDAVLGLSASDDGRALLRGTRVVDALRRLLGDRAETAQAAVSALVNLSADAAALDAIVRAGLVGGLMEALRDPDCSFKAPVLMLLTNLSQTPEGCEQLMQKGVAGGALVGLHFRRLVQMFVASGAKLPAAAGRVDGGAGDGADALAYSGAIVHNLTQLVEARHILLEPERGILPALAPQLHVGSATRRRAAAGMLRNCCAHTEPAFVAYLLAPPVDVVTHLLLPLAGPDRYARGEKDGMARVLYTAPALGGGLAGGGGGGGDDGDDGSSEAAAARRLGFARGPQHRERDAPTRRLVVEALALLATTRAGREHLRRARSYPVVRTFHEWLEGHEPGLLAAAAAGEEDVHAARSGGGGMVGARSSSSSGDDDGDGDGDELTDPDDVATVDAVNRLVQQLFRDDEVAHTSEVTGRHKPGEEEEGEGEGGEGAGDDGEGAAAGGGGGGRDDDLGPLPQAQQDALVVCARRAAAHAAHAEEVAAVRARMYKYATVPEERAREIAVEAARGRHHRPATAAGGSGAPLRDEDALGLDGSADAMVMMKLPDWTEEDPDLAGTVFDVGGAGGAGAGAVAGAGGEGEVAPPGGDPDGAQGGEPAGAASLSAGAPAAVLPLGGVGAAAGVPVGGGGGGGGASSTAVAVAGVEPAAGSGAGAASATLVAAASAPAVGAATSVAVFAAVERAGLGGVD